MNHQAVLEEVQKTAAELVERLKSGDVDRIMSTPHIEVVGSALAVLLSTIVLVVVLGLKRGGKRSTDK